jgi:hypothetical protein
VSFDSSSACDCNCDCDIQPFNEDPCQGCQVDEPLLEASCVWRTKIRSYADAEEGVGVRVCRLC